MKFIAMLMPLLLSFAGKILTALGLSVVTYVGFDAVMLQFKAMISTHVGQMGVEWLNLFYLVGGGTVLNILFGAMTFSVSFKALSRITVGDKR